MTEAQLYCSFAPGGIITLVEDIFMINDFYITSWLPRLTTTATLLPWLLSCIFTANSRLRGVLVLHVCELFGVASETFNPQEPLVVKKRNKIMIRLRYTNIHYIYNIVYFVESASGRVYNSRAQITTISLHCNAGTRYYFSNGKQTLNIYELLQPRLASNPCV